jgi:hypothetical protein
LAHNFKDRALLLYAISKIIEVCDSDLFPEQVVYRVPLSREMVTFFSFRINVISLFYKNTKDFSGKNLKFFTILF